MQTDLFKCPFCSKSYDLELHPPKILTSCQHCLCLGCIKNIFINHPPEERQCPSCKINLLPTIMTPEAFPNEPALFHLLRTQQKATHEGYCKEVDQTQTLNAKQSNELEEHFQDQVRKKLKREQEIDHQQAKKNDDESEDLFKDKVPRKQKSEEQDISGELENLQELIINQFTDMRKMLHAHQNIQTSGQIEDLFLPHADLQENRNSLAEIANSLKEILSETQKTLNRLSKNTQANDKEVSKPFQKIDISERNEDEIKTEAEASTPSRTAYFDIFQNLDQGNYKIFTPSVTSDELEERFEDFCKSDEKIFRIKQDIQEAGTEAKSQDKLDLSNRDTSDDIFAKLSSEEENRACNLEANFSSASSLTDRQFKKFVQNMISHMKNLTSVEINLAHTKITHKSMQALSQGLKNYKLKSFKLECSHTAIGEKGIKFINKGLSWSAETLENIEIMLDSNNLEGGKFLDSLMRMNQLKHLKLSVENSHISSEAVSSLMLCLQSLAQKLESLDLNFNGTDIDDDDLGNFSTQIVSQMERLKRFKLSLGNTLISENFLLGFFQSLTSLTAHLEVLELDFHFLEFYNISFKHVCDDVLSQMPNLKSLKFDLSPIKMIESSQKTMILPIQKLESIDSEEEQLRPKRKKRELKFDVETQVFMELKKELSLHYDHKKDPLKLDVYHASRLIERLEPEDYDNMLTKILKKILLISDASAAELEKWKEIIKKWIENRLKWISQHPRKMNGKEKHPKTNENDKKIETNEKTISIEKNQYHDSAISAQNNIKVETQQNTSPIKRKQSRSKSRRKKKTYSTQRKNSKSIERAKEN